MNPSKADIRNREAIDKLHDLDPLHPSCIFCGSGALTWHEREGFSRIVVYYCKECKKRFEKVVEKKLTKPKESYKEYR